MVLKIRELFVRQRTRTSNAVRADMAELRVIAATGMAGIDKPIAILRDETDTRLPSPARSALPEMAEPIERLPARIEALDTKIVRTVKEDETAQRLTRIPGVGPIIAATVRAAIQDPGFRGVPNRA